MSQLIENIVSKKENEKYYWLTIGQRIWLKVSEFYIIFKMKTYFIDLYVQYFQKRKFNFQGYIDTSNLKNLVTKLAREISEYCGKIHWTKFTHVERESQSGLYSHNTMQSIRLYPNDIGLWELFAPFLFKRYTPYTELGSIYATLVLLISSTNSI